MAYQRIRIKNSNVAGKVPTAGQLDTSELCINLKDHKLYSKDADNNVFELTSDSGTSVGNGPIPPSNGNEIGDLWWDGTNLLVWNGTSWEQVGPVKSVNGLTGEVVLDIPDKTSDLTNDGENGVDPFITESDVENYLTNNGYITDPGVTEIVAGDNITISPIAGTGSVTINAADAPNAPVTSVNGEVGDVVLDLADINDVTLTNIANGDIVSWNGTAWVNSAAPPADISGSSISNLSDVDTTGVSDEDILVWNQASGEWQPQPQPVIPDKTSDLTNDGADGANPFISEAEVNNILNGNNPDGTPNAGAEAYLKSGDNVSELVNDANYITLADVPEIPTKTSDLTNDGENGVDPFITDAGVTKVIAGNGIAVTPIAGTGDVTIESTVSSLEFAGPVDVTSSIVPALVRSANALYVNTGTGKFSPEWAAVTKNADVTTDANPGDFMIKDLEDQASDPWTWTDSGTPPASDGLWVEAGGEISPATPTNTVLVGGSTSATATIKLTASGTVTAVVYDLEVLPTLP